jgi:hypothetical protein
MTGTDRGNEAPVRASSGNTGVGTRTPDLRIMRPPSGCSKTMPENHLSQSPSSVAEHLPNDTCKTDPDLAAVVEAWPDLPEALKAGIVAMVKAARS